MVHTPVLQSFDTSPASIQAFQRQQDFAAQKSRVSSLTAMGRSFVQGPVDGDIFGIRIPAPVGTSTPVMAQRGHRRGMDLDSSEFELSGTRRTSNENRQRGVMMMDNIEPRKTPAWIRQGPPAPLGEMRMDPRASLDFDSSALDNSEQLDHSMDVGDEGMEWPPSPKKSPVKRKLVFRATADENMGGSQQRNEDMFMDVESSFVQTADAEEDEGEDSLLMNRTSRQHNIAGPSRSLRPQETDQPTALPQFNPARPAARPRKSLMRRRRTTVHEDPITSPRLDPSNRISKPGSSSSSSSLASSGSEASLHALNAVFGHARQDEPEKGVRSAGSGKQVGLVETDETPRKGEARRLSDLECKLWDACGGELDRWNAGEFGMGLVGEIGTVRW